MSTPNTRASEQSRSLIRNRFRSSPETSENPVFIGTIGDPSGSQRVRKRQAEPETAGSTAGSTCTSWPDPPHPFPGRHSPNWRVGSCHAARLPRPQATPGSGLPRRASRCAGAPRPATRSRAQPTNALRQPPRAAVPQGVSKGRPRAGRSGSRPGTANVIVTPGGPRHQLCHLPTAPTSGTSRGRGRIVTATSPSRQPTPPSSCWRGRCLALPTAVTAGGASSRFSFAFLPAVPRRGRTAAGTLARKGMILCRERRRQPAGDLPQGGVSLLFCTRFSRVRVWIPNFRRESLS